VDFGSIPSDAMTPWPLPLLAPPARALHESLESKITFAIRGESTKLQHLSQKRHNL
jgi:hypothetical protein